jgi:hypothetical protein
MTIDIDRERKALRQRMKDAGYQWESIEPYWEPWKWRAEQAAKDEAARQPPTWLCGDCLAQWQLSRIQIDAKEKP